jgi:hypothetical protein
MNIELHIERLVLHGAEFTPGGRDALAGAFSRELTRLIQADGVAPALLSGTAVPGLTATMASPGPVSALGRDIARSVYSCLGPR